MEYWIWNFAVSVLPERFIKFHQHFINVFIVNDKISLKQAFSKDVISLLYDFSNTLNNNIPSLIKFQWKDSFYKRIRRVSSMSNSDLYCKAEVEGCRVKNWWLRIESEEQSRHENSCKQAWGTTSDLYTVNDISLCLTVRRVGVMGVYYKFV